MARPRIMLDVRFFHSPKIAALANRQKLGFISLLCEAKQQDRQGVFANRPVLTLAAGGFKDCIPAWIEAGVIHYAPALCAKCEVAFPDVPLTAAVVHDWHDYQEEPSRWTTWRRNKAAPLDATSDAPSVAPLTRATRASRSRSSSTSTEGGPGETPGYPASEERDCLDTYHELTRWRPWGIWSGDKLKGAASEYGDDNVSSALRAEAAVDADRNTLLDRSLARLARETEHNRRVKPKPRLVKVRDEAAIAAAKAELMGETA